MRPSQWPLRYKIEAVVLYVLAMAGVYVVAKWFVNWLPGEWVWPFNIAFFAALGALALYGHLRDRRHRPSRDGRDGETL